MTLTSDYDFHLPPELIAQQPLPERTDARMLVLDRQTGRTEHRHVRDLAEYLRAGDLLVLNNTRVIPARLYGRKDTGGKVEVLLLEETEPDVWNAMCRASGRVREGSRFSLGNGRISAVVLDARPSVRVRLRLAADRPVREVLEEEGVPPLPPYIRRSEGGPSDVRVADRERYQTVYARIPGAVAAPTAGLHFTPELLARLDGIGVGRVELTLHVGPGTFKPVGVEALEDHVMEPERYVLGEEAACRVRETRSRGSRIVAVGSTSTRVLETAADEGGIVQAGQGRTALFIHPPYRFRVVDCLLTNFHLPRSTLLMMVSALAGRDRILSAYGEAVRLRYRFYSYGECMLIL